MDALIQAALRSGGRDNITVIVIDARNVLNDAGTATTAPRRDADVDAEREVTLPRAQAVEPVTQPLPEQATDAATAGSEEPGDDRH